MEIPGFDLVTSRTDGGAVVRVIGELDLATAPQLGQVLTDLTGHGIHVTVDLSGMAFIDSTGVSALVSGLKRLREAGGDMALVSPRASALKVFEITGLTNVFTIHNEAADASANGAHHLHSEDTMNA